MGIIGFILKGDRTSHGGEVQTGDETWIVQGRAVACLGDQVSCPRCQRTVTIATSRFPFITINGRIPAFEGDLTDCGAILHSRHNEHAGWGEGAGAANATVATPPPPDVHVPPRCQEHFVLRHAQTGEPLANLRYTINTREGARFDGETDAEGRTRVVWTTAPQAVELVVHARQAKDADPYHYAELDYEGL